MTSRRPPGRLASLRTIAPWVLLGGSLIGWPLSAFTLARNEPQFVLGLSWLAIILTAADLLSTSQVYEKQDDDRS
jgi:hypothetical protein